MIELPNNKISRNLPEQVGFNSAKIAEIIKWINDSDFLDKVIDLIDPSGTLSGAQYDIADLSPSYIVYGGKVFVKSLEDSSNIDFLKVGTDMSGSGSIVASVERVRVVKATKAYQYETVQLFESYNKTQLDTLLSAKADLSGANFTGAVTAKTLSQNEYEYSKEIVLTHSTTLTITNIYNRFAIINNVLYCIINFKLKNETGAAVTVGDGYGFLGSVSMSIDSAVASKVYDINGDSVSEVVTSGTLISSEPCHVFKTSKIDDTTVVFYNARLSLANRSAENTLAVYVGLNGGSGNRIALNPDEELFVTGRMALTLL